jgi:site-specific DNA-methyltransferase (cytosine-N4-specific)
MTGSSKTTKKVQMTLDGRSTMEDWSFAKADTSYLTHGFHDYPARMIPQIAERLIERYTPESGGEILDPFCGSGTTLVEAQLANRKAIGNDINPLAVLISKVKATPIDFAEKGFDAVTFYEELHNEYTNAKKHNNLPNPPTEIYHGLLHWFKEPVTVDLQFLYQAISEVRDEDIRNFLKLVFSDTVFKTSNIDLRASRFIRIYHEPELSKFKPNVLRHFHTKLIDSTSRMNQFVRKLKAANIETNLVQVRRGDARHLPFNEGDFDGAITSPPYGEEKSTIGYARWSKLSIAWLRLGEEIKDSNKNSLGAIAEKDVLEKLNNLESPTALEVLREFVKADPERVRDALPFFFDYYDTLKEVYRVLKHRSYYCVVIGDRSIRKKLLDMEKVSVELGTEAGFKHVHSFFRNIPMKLIPWDTPTGKTIFRESIIVLRKE